MPFGKFAGQSVDTLPLDYCGWLLTRDIWPDLREAVEARVRLSKIGQVVDAEFARRAAAAAVEGPAEAPAAGEYDDRF